MNICIVAGARPNFIKVAPIVRAIIRAKNEGKNIDYQLVYAGRKDDPTLEPTLFSDKPEEVKELESRIQTLERSLYMCQTAVKAAKVGIRMAPGNALGIITDCLNTVVANSPKFMGEPVSEPENEREG